MPLPLRLGFIELPVLGDVPGVAELAAGSPVVEPRPLGAPPCAFAKVPESASAAAIAIGVSFMAVPFGMTTTTHRGRQVPSTFSAMGVADLDGPPKASTGGQPVCIVRIGE